VDEANARLLKQANDFIALNRDPAVTPEQAKDKSWMMFQITESVRALCLFHSKSSHFPGRLKPENRSRNEGSALALRQRGKPVCRWRGKPDRRHRHG